MVKCHICGAKAKRTCQIKGGVEICPQCCATTRSRECTDCSYYTTSQKYKQEKQIKSGKRDFFMEIKPELEDRIGDALALIEKGRYTLAESMLDKAIELDPDYEPAIINRAAISSGIEMPEGQIPMVEYAKDYQVKKKSLIKDVFSKLFKQ